MTDKNALEQLAAGLGLSVEDFIAMCCEQKIRREGFISVMSDDPCKAELFAACVVASMARDLSLPAWTLESVLEYLDLTEADGNRDLLCILPLSNSIH